MNTTNRAAKTDRNGYEKSSLPPLRMARSNPYLRNEMVKAATIEIEYASTDRNGYSKRAR